MNDKFMQSISRKELYDLQIKVYKAIIQETKKLYPDSKFVFLIYCDKNEDIVQIESWNVPQKEINEEFEILYSDKFKKDIENLGATVITTEELIGRKMDKEEDRIPKSIDENYPHPSEKAWDKIVPKLVQRLNL